MKSGIKTIIYSVKDPARAKTLYTDGNVIGLIQSP